MPYSSWKSVEIEIFDENDNYLFTFHDELWSEKGRTGGESWKESRTKAYADIWFPSAGTYKAYLSDTYSTRIAENTGYRVAIFPVNGDRSDLTKWFWIFGILIVCILAYWGEKSEREDDKDFWKPITPVTEKVKEKKSSNRFFIILAIFMIPVLISCADGYYNFFPYSSWHSYASAKKNMTVDRTVRNDNHRTRSRSGGK